MFCVQLFFQALVEFINLGCSWNERIQCFLDFQRPNWMFVRATSHTSQELWPCNGADPWLSSKGHTISVGKVVLGMYTDLQAQCEVRMDLVAYFVGGKRGEGLVNIICLKLYQFERTTWWCLWVVEFVMESILEYALEYIMLNNIKKSWSTKICVKPTSWMYAWRKFLETIKPYP